MQRRSQRISSTFPTTPKASLIHPCELWLAQTQSHPQVAHSLAVVPPYLEGFMDACSFKKAPNAQAQATASGKR
jgi:hypothetical protein